ncbi:MAG TPA: 4-aminobutyrate--2-oxoglutarate transaminase [Croceibacterium sp.]|nr:4-aminobutyrate--2-oxoglutarate transaminase [Croceibacterium sp.]
MNGNNQLFERRFAAVPASVANATPVFAAKALNSEVWDAEGNRYVDFAAGIATLNVGHCHPRVIAAVERQLTCFTHTAFQVMPYENYIALAERLNAIAPFSARAQTVLFTTGAEAVENAVKIARTATDRAGIISFTEGFHGRTSLTSTLTGKIEPYKSRRTPGLPNVFHVPFPSEARGVTVEDSLRALDFVFAASIHPSNVAAIILEPVQGEGGVNVAPRALLTALRALCDAHGILLIADEVQTGFARTGRMFAIEHSGVEPDLVTVAKSLAGGFPLSGVIGRADLFAALSPGTLGGTYGGSPIGCAAALAVLDVIEEEGLVARASVIGDRLRGRIEGWGRRNDLLPISPPRGLGAMVGFDILARRGSSETDPAMAKTVCQRALDQKLVVLNCGQRGESIRILAPLTASDAIMDEGMESLEAALSAAL